MRSKTFERKAQRHRLVHELRAAGASYREIAEKVGVKSVTIWKYLKTPEPVIPPRRALSLERFEIAKKMKAEGATYQQIGLHFGICAQAAVELLTESDGVPRSGECSECHRHANKLVFHHTDYLKDEGVWICQSCHSKNHPEALNAAKAARADKRVEDKKTILAFIGWTQIETSVRANGRRNIKGVPPLGTKAIEAPDALKDLNTLHLAEMALTPVERREYRELLASIVGDPNEIAFANSNQRSEAILAMIRKTKPLTTAAAPTILTP